MKNLANTQRFARFTTNLFRKRCFFSQLKLFCDNFYKERNVPRKIQLIEITAFFLWGATKALRFLLCTTFAFGVFIISHPKAAFNSLQKIKSKRFSLANFAASFWNCIALRKKLQVESFRKGWYLTFAFGPFTARTLFCNCKHCVRIVKLLCWFCSFENSWPFVGK